MKKLIVAAMIAGSSSYALSSEAIGFFSNGELRNPVSIIEYHGNELHKLFHKREKFYGTEELLNVIKDIAHFSKSVLEGSETIQVGDLSAVYGGNAPGHASHQNGLDVDMVYLTKKSKLQNPEASFWEEEFIYNGKITDNFDTKRNLDLFNYIVHKHPVRRIFVDQLIKDHLCTYASKQGLINDEKIIETLRRLRPAKLHTNHFHLRLTCPKDDAECIEQVEVPEGSGC